MRRENSWDGPTNPIGLPYHSVRIPGLGATRGLTILDGCFCAVELLPSLPKVWCAQAWNRVEPKANLVNPLRNVAGGLVVMCGVSGVVRLCCGVVGSVRSEATR